MPTDTFGVVIAAAGFVVCAGCAALIANCSTNIVMQTCAAATLRSVLKQPLPCEQPVPQAADTFTLGVLLKGLAPGGLPFAYSKKRAAALLAVFEAPGGLPFAYSKKRAAALLAVFEEQVAKGKAV